MIILVAYFWDVVSSDKLMFCNFVAGSPDGVIIGTGIGLPVPVSLRPRLAGMGEKHRSGPGKLPLIRLKLEGEYQYGRTVLSELFQMNILADVLLPLRCSDVLLPVRCANGQLRVRCADSQLPVKCADDLLPVRCADGVLLPVRCADGL